MSNPFFDFLKYWPKPFRKKLEYKYEPSYLKSAFRFIFWIWEVVKLNICKYVYLHIFQFEHRLKSKFNSKSRFEIRMWIILYWFFFKLALTLYFVLVFVLHYFMAFSSHVSAQNFQSDNSVCSKNPTFRKYVTIPPG